MSKGLKVAPPPRRPEAAEAPKTPARKRVPTKLRHVAETDMVQFNKRISSGTADGFALLAVKTKLKIPELLDEALELLEQKYGKV